MLTAKGARISSGRISRNEVISQFQAHGCQVPAAARVEVLLSTDLLSEGVNLQGAQVVIHLDLPWTAARLEQRVGRAARIGSTHGTVYVHSLLLPASARRFLTSDQIITAKWRTANSAIGNSGVAPFAATGPDFHAQQSIPALTECLRGILQRWRSGGADTEPGVHPLIASCESTAAGFIAALRSGDKTSLVCASVNGVSGDLDTLIEQCGLADGPDIPMRPACADLAIDTIEEWIAARHAAEIAGLTSSSELVHRPSLVDRIDASVRSAPPHLRPARSRLAAAARAAAARFLSAAAEYELQSLARSDLPADEWLQAVAAFAPAHGNGSADNESTPQRIIAVLLLTPPPPPSGCAGE